MSVGAIIFNLFFAFITIWAVKDFLGIFRIITQKNIKFIIYTDNIIKIKGRWLWVFWVEMTLINSGEVFKFYESYTKRNINVKIKHPNRPYFNF